MKDKFGNTICPGDEIVYAVERHNMPQLKYAVVYDAFDDRVVFRSQGGDGPLRALSHSDRIVIIREGYGNQTRGKQ